MSAQAISLRATPGPTSVIACVGETPRAKTIIAVGAQLAQMLDLPLTLLRVIETVDETDLRPDPLEWDLYRHQARRQLSRLAGDLAFPDDKIRFEVAEGERVQVICDRANETGSILVIGTPDSDNSFIWSRDTAQRVLEASTGPVLLVPDRAQVSQQSYARIMVPLDGSSYSEAALVEAIHLARWTGAEVLLAHVVPEVAITRFGPPECSDVELQLRLSRRNERAACHFLERTQRHLIDQGIKARSLCLNGDVRTMLQRTIAAEKPDLLILTARGQGGKSCHDLTIGSTANYLLTHLDQPALLVRSSQALAKRQQSQSSQLARRPTPAFAA